MDRAFDPRPTSHHRVAVRDVFSFSLDARRLAHRVGPVDDAAKLLDLVLDGPYELVDGEVTQDTPNMRVRKPVRLTVLLFELDEEQRPKPGPQATILKRCRPDVRFARKPTWLDDLLSGWGWKPPTSSRRSRSSRQSFHLEAAHLAW